MPVTVTSTSDPTVFLERARPYLGTRPVEHSVILTNASRRLDGLWTVVERDGMVAAAGMLTPPHALQVSLGSADDLAALAHHHRAAGRNLPGVGGMREPAEAFASVWSQLRGVAAHERKAMGVHVCDRVRPPAGVRGRLRAGRPDEVTLLTTWAQGFGADTGQPVGDDAVPDRLARGTLRVWEVDGAPVSMAALSGREHGWSRVQLVYTPPGLRGRGYASACVAAMVEQDLRDGGRSMLFTDLAAPTPNRIYAAIGFRRVGDAVRIGFGPEAAA